jgi:hypothetical protein
MTPERLAEEAHRRSDSAAARRMQNAKLALLKRCRNSSL